MNYTKSTDKLGTVIILCGVGLLLAVPFAFSIFFNVWPSFKQVMFAVLPTLAIYIPVQIIEIATYVPLLGRGGSYLAFITGNISNLKAPVVMTALKSAEVEPSSEEGEIISTLAVATSALVTNVVLALGVVLFLVTGLAKVMQAPMLAPAFDNLLAALFGALGVVFIGKNWKIAIAPIVLMLTLFLVLPDGLYNKYFSVLIPFAAALAIGVARILYVKGRI